MKIGLNLLFLIPQEVGGTETYAVSLINALCQFDSINEYYLFLNKENALIDIPNRANVHKIICPIRARSRFLRYAYEQIILPAQLIKLKIELIHSLGYVGPLWKVCKHVVTIYDINYIKIKQYIKLFKRSALTFFSIKSAQTADHIITVSQYSKDDICSYLKIYREKITVAYGAPPSTYQTLTSLQWFEIKEKYTIMEPYIVAFGGGHEHKNIPRLLKAFATMGRSFPHSLVLIGKIFHRVNLTALEGNIGKRIITTGYIPREHIGPILHHAELFVFPSLYEGFGLPLVEAQQAKVAVVSSNAGSLPEIGGDGAIYFDPESETEMTAAMAACLRDGQLREKLIAKGIDNLKRFSWEKTASATLGVYEQLSRES